MRFIKLLCLGVSVLVYAESLPFKTSLNVDTKNLVKRIAYDHTVPVDNSTTSAVPTDASSVKFSSTDVPARSTPTDAASSGNGSMSVTTSTDTLSDTATGSAASPTLMDTVISTTDTLSSTVTSTSTGTSTATSTETTSTATITDTKNTTSSTDVPPSSTTASTVTASDTPDMATSNVTRTDMPTTSAPVSVSLSTTVTPTTNAPETPTTTSTVTVTSTSSTSQDTSTTLPSTNTQIETPTSSSSSSSSSASPIQTSNQSSVQTLSTPVASATTSSVDSATSTTSQSTPASLSMYQYSSLNWLPSSMDLTAVPAVGSSSPIAQMSSTSTTNAAQVVPQFITPNTNVAIPSNSVSVSMKFNAISYPQMVQDPVLAAQVISRFPTIIANSLGISPSDVIILSICSADWGTSQSVNMKRRVLVPRQTTTGIVVMFAIPSDQVNNLQAQIQNPQSPLRSSVTSGQLGQLVDPSYSLTTTVPNDPSQEKVPSVNDPNAQSSTNGGSSASGSGTTGGVSRGVIIGVAVAGCTFLYAGMTTLVIRHYRKKKAAQAIKAHQRLLYNQAISGPVMQENSLGFTRYSGQSL